MESCRPKPEWLDIIQEALLNVCNDIEQIGKTNRLLLPICQSWQFPLAPSVEGASCLPSAAHKSGSQSVELALFGVLLIIIFLAKRLDRLQHIVVYLNCEKFTAAPAFIGALVVRVDQ